MAKLSKTDLSKYPDNKKMRVYAGGEVRTYTVAHLKRLQEQGKKRKKR